MNAVRIAIAVLAVAGCDPAAFGPSPTLTDAGVSPGASIRPSPLDDPALAQRDAGGTKQRPPDASVSKADAAPSPPAPFDAYQPPPADRITSRDVAGVQLSMRWRWSDVPEPAETPYTDKAAITAARDAADATWNLYLTNNGRMRIDVTGRAQPLAANTALLGRIDRYGHAILWPDGARYRLLAPGALRNTLGELRADVSPLSRGKVTEVGPGSHLGVPTREVEVRSAVGSVRLQLGVIVEAGAGAPLACRLLVELAGIDPSTQVCATEEVALSAHYVWPASDGESRGVAFEAEQITRKPELRAARFLLPPAQARIVSAGLPTPRHGVFFSAEELARFRTEAEADPVTPSTPKQGLAANNRSDLTMWLLLDGARIATVRPWTEALVRGPRAGRYNIQWRTFLGEVVAEAAEKDLPGSILFGEPLAEDKSDAGAP